MGIDFGALPPEITSARIYAGPGSSSLVAASSGWNALAAELSSTALSYDKVVTALTSEEWLGPASAAMAEAVQPYVGWLTSSAAQAEQAASQAQAAAAAFENVFATVVPPPVIAANRAQLAQALSTNVLGQNNGIIAALETEYGEFWAQNTGAMFTYAGNSASAAKVTPFTEAPAIANPAAAATQAAATTPLPAGILGQLLQALPTQLQQLALNNPITGPIIAELNNLQLANGPLSWLWQLVWGTSAFPSSLNALAAAYTPYAGLFYNTEGLPYFSIGMGNFLTQTAKTVGALGGAAPAAAAAPRGLSGLGSALGGGGQVAAGLGNGAHVAGLTVPAAWSGAVPGAHAGATSIPVQSISAAPESGGAGNLLGGMPLAGTGAGRGAGAGPRYGFKPTVMARPPYAG
jgi:PPE-repeat protein